jgi:hypothetical protein
VDEGRVIDIAAQVQEAGPDEIVLADTIGVGVPKQVRSLVAGVRGVGATVGCHFHNTRNTGLANALAAVESGAMILDSSIGGTSFPSLAIPVVKVPPDIDGGAIFTLGNKSFTNQVMTNGGVDGKHTYSFSLSQV